MIQRLGTLLPSQFKAFKQYADESIQAELVVKKFLAEPLKSHCRVSRFSEGCLTISVADSIWLTPLRYQLPQLRDHLRSHELFYGLCSIDLAVQPHLHELAKKIQPVVERPLSASVKALIQTTSEQVKYEPLSEALRQLARV